jgi:pimeloyl-ACP methyl ester carboxylesterase
MAVLSYGTGDYRTGEAAVTGSSRSIATTSRRAVLYAHGAGGTAAGDETVPYISTLQQMAEHGYPVHAGDYGSSTWKISGGVYNWGNSDHVAAIAAGGTWMGTLPGVKNDKVCLVGGSMGATGAMNYYKANPTKVAAIALIIPLLDLADLSSTDKGFVTNTLAPSMNGLTLPQATINLTNTVASSGLSLSGLPGLASGAGKVNVVTSAGVQVVSFTGTGTSSLTGCTGGTGTCSTGAAVTQGYGASLVTAYGNTWPTLLSGAQLAANSPAAWAATAGGLTVPVKIWASDNDPIASSTAACQAFAGAVAAAGGGNVTPVVQSLGAVGHYGGSISPLELVQWFNANGGLS